MRWFEHAEKRERERERERERDCRSQARRDVQFCRYTLYAMSLMQMNPHPPNREEEEESLFKRRGKRMDISLDLFTITRRLGNESPVHMEKGNVRELRESPLGTPSVY